MKKLSYLTEASIMAAGIAGLLFLSSFVGYSLGDVFPFLLPIPLGIYALRHGGAKTIIPASAISILSFLIFDFVYCLAFIVPGAIIGVVFGYLLTLQVKENWRLLFLFLGNLITGVITTVFLSQILYGISVSEDVALLTQGIVDIFPPSLLNENTTTIIYALAFSLMPTIIIVYSLMSAFITNMGTQLLARRIMKETKFISSRPFAWHLSWPFAVAFLVMVLLVTYFISDWSMMDAWVQVILMIIINITAIIGFLFMGQGLLIAGKYSRINGKMWVYWIYALSFIFFPPLPLLTGVFDSLKGMSNSIKH